MTASIFLSQEELIYLLQLLQLANLPGMSLNPLAGTDEQQFLSAMSIAERCLRARGFIQFDIAAQRMNIESAVVGTLSFCARAPQSIAVRRMQADGRQVAAMYHLSAPLKIKHQAVMGVHEFALIQEANSVLNDIMNLITDDVVMKTVDLETIAEMPASVLVAAGLLRRADQVNDNEMIDALRHLGVDEVEAKHINHIFRHELVASVVIGPWSPPLEGVDSFPALALLQGKNVWWVLAPHDNQQVAQAYTLYQMGSAEIRDILAHSFAPYMKATID
jgi:hypothetical protein